MLRRLLFSLVLVAAAFAGGAAINGPGLAWLQRSVLGGPTIIVDGPAPGPSDGSKKPPGVFPTARAAPLAVELPRAPEPTKATATATEAGPPPTSEPLSATTPTRAAAPEPGPSPPTADAKGAPADLDLDLGLLPKADPVARLASAETREPAAGPPSTPAPAPPSTARDWAEIRRRMRALGVARYSMEAESEGRVRFSCVIPVDGLRAIGHHFEADGDDEYQAADAALRRVALWQATEAK